jgi:hypothetical protein
MSKSIDKKNENNFPMCMEIESNQNFEEFKKRENNDDLSYYDRTVKFLRSEKFKMIINPFRNDSDPTLRYCYYCLWTTVICMFSYIFLLIILSE